jgi:anti-sigma factor RsiW
MNCYKAKKKLSAYLDGEVSGADRKEIAEHLKSCRGCQEELAALSRISNTLDAIGRMEVPPYFMTRVRQGIRDAAKPVPFLERIRGIAMSFATATAVVVSLLIGNQFGKILYQSVAPTVVSGTTDTGDVFGFETLQEFPDGSLSDIYSELLAGGNNG